MYEAVTVPASSSSSSSYVHFLRLAHQRHGGAQFGQLIEWPFVAVEDIEQLDAKIRNFNTDVFVASVGDAPNIATDPEGFAAWQGRTAELIDFKWSWTSYRVGWSGWVDDHYSTLSRVGDSVVVEFEAFGRGYNEMRRRFTELMGADATSAPPAKTEPKGKPDVIGAVKFASVAVVALAGVYLYTQLKD